MARERTNVIRDLGGNRVPSSMLISSETNRQGSFGKMLLIYCSIRQTWMDILGTYGNINYKATQKGQIKSIE